MQEQVATGTFTELNPAQEMQLYVRTAIILETLEQQIAALEKENIELRYKFEKANKELVQMKHEQYDFIEF